MFKKPFNRTIGEERVCKGCGNQYHTHKPRWKCLDCLAILQRKYVKPYNRKEQYPFDNRNGDAGKRFCSIRTALSNAWKKYRKTGDRNIITEHYSKQLKEIEQNGILKWILDRRDKQTSDAKITKSRKTIQRDYPNHHDYYEY